MSSDLALVCVSKGILVGVLTFYLFPVGGGFAVALLLLLDRLHLNLTAIVDVNLIISIVAALTAETRDRAQHGLESPVGIVFAGVWVVASIGLSAVQPLSIRVEILVLSAMAALTSATQQAPEPIWLLILRIVGFITPLLLSAYTDCGGGFDLVLGLLRAAPIMLAPPIPALVMAPLLSAVVVWRWRQAQPPVEPMGLDSMSEQALLREALARQKSALQHMC